MDKQWLITYGPDLGNALMSGIGLAFAIGAPLQIVNAPANTPEVSTGTRLNILKIWWVIFWASLLMMYPWYAFVHDSKAIHPWAIFHGVSTAAVVMLWLYSNQEKQRQTKVVIVFFLVFFLAVASSYLDYWKLGKNLVITIIAYLFSWLVFLLLAFSYRRQIKTALVFLVYAFLQIPTKPVEDALQTSSFQPSFQLDVVVLIAAKTTLIGAMYSTLGVEDKKK